MYKTVYDNMLIIEIYSNSTNDVNSDNNINNNSNDNDSGYGSSNDHSSNNGHNSSTDSSMTILTTTLHFMPILYPPRCRGQETIPPRTG